MVISPTSGKRNEISNNCVFAISRQEASQTHTHRDKQTGTHIEVHAHTQYYSVCRWKNGPYGKSSIRNLGEGRWCLEDRDRKQEKRRRPEGRGGRKTDRPEAVPSPSPRRDLLHHHLSIIHPPYLFYPAKNISRLLQIFV